MLLAALILGGSASATLVVRSYRKQARQARESFDWFKQSLTEHDAGNH